MSRFPSTLQQSVLQSLSQDKAVPDGTSECSQIDDCRNTVQHAKSFVQLLHSFGVRASVRILLAIASF